MDDVDTDQGKPTPWTNADKVHLALRWQAGYDERCPTCGGEVKFDKSRQVVNASLQFTCLGCGNHGSYILNGPDQGKIR